MFKQTNARSTSKFKKQAPKNTSSTSAKSTRRRRPKRRVAQEAPEERMRRSEVSSYVKTGRFPRDSGNRYGGLRRTRSLGAIPNVVPRVRSFEFQNKIVSLESKGRSLTDVKVGSRRRGGGMGSQLIPPHKFVELQYNEFFKVATATAGVGELLYPIRTNAAFAVDTGANAPTTTPGFSVMAIAYSAYEVVEYSGYVEFVGDVAATQEPLRTYVIHSQTNMGAAAGGSTGINFPDMVGSREKWYTAKTITGATGGPNYCKHTFRHKISKIAGEPITQNPNYESLTSTVPASLTYMLIGISSRADTTGGGAFSSCDIAVTLNMKVKFLHPIETLVAMDDPFEGNKDPTRLRPIACAGCKFLQISPYVPCECGTYETCTTCLYTHPCCDICRTNVCTKREIPIPIFQPGVTPGPIDITQKKKSTKKDFTVAHFPVLPEGILRFRAAAAANLPRPIAD